MAEFDPSQPYEVVAEKPVQFDPTKPFEVVEPKEDIGYGEAIQRGVRKGASFNFSDEIAGARAAGAPAPDLPPGPTVFGLPVDVMTGAAKLGYEKLTGRGDATEKYEKAKEKERADIKTAEEQYPKTMLASELGSALLPTPMMGVKIGTTIPKMAGAGAKLGATYGTLSGLGEGEGIADTIAKGQTGGILGAGAGAVLGPVVGKAAQGVSKWMGRAGEEVAEGAAKAVPEGDDLVAKMTTALKEAVPLEKKQADIYHEIRSKQASTLAGIQKDKPGEAGFHAQLGSLKGELPKVEYESIRPLFTQDNIDSLFSRINLSDALQPFEKINAQTGLGKLLGEFGGTVPTKSELAYLGKVFPQEFIDAATDARPTSRAIMEELGDVVNIPRAIMASFDLSAPFRQGWGMIGRQKQFAPAVRDMAKAFYDPKFAAESDAALRARPTFKRGQDAGLAIMDPQHGASLGLKEERFQSNLAHEVPIMGKGIEASDRAYTHFLNQVRQDVFDDLIAKAERLGHTNNPRLDADLARYINTFTGRGTFKKFGDVDRHAIEQAAPLLNGLFFSPRLIMSRLNMINPWYYASLHPFVAKEALRDLLTSTGSAVSIISLAAYAGADVILDRINPDFGKIKLGHTRFDVSGGIQPELRLLAQISPDFMGGGKAVSSTSGRTRTFGEGFKPETRADAFFRFLESKEAPVASFIHSMAKGSGFTGKDFNALQEVVKRTTPMMLQDLWELQQEWGSELGTVMTVPGALGVGSQTYGKVQLEEGKNKAGLPTAQIGSPPHWGEYAVTHGSRPWKAVFGEGETPKGSSKRYDIETFMRDNYTKMSPEEKAQFAKTVDQNPNLKKSIKKVQKEMAAGMTPAELDMKARPTGDGTRALAIKKELDALPNDDEKRKLLNRYKNIRIISPEVRSQLNKLKAFPRIDPSGTIPTKDQDEIEKVLQSIPRAYGGRVFFRAEGGRAGGGPYTREELEASAIENAKHYQNLSHISARLAPQGVPWKSWRRSKNVEDRTQEQEGDVSPTERATRRTFPLYTMEYPPGELSRQAGYDDIGKKRGGRLKRRIPPTATIPESAATLKRQQQGLISGQRPAMLFPHRGTELALPKGMRRMKTKEGLLHFNPKLLKPSQIKTASEKGKMNDLLGLGPVSKEEALGRTAKGELPLAVVERGADGVEAKAAMGTDRTAPDQIAAMEEEAMPGDMVGVEPVEETLARRLEEGGAVERHPITGRPFLGDATEESITITHPRMNEGRPTNIPSIWDGRRPPWSTDTEEGENWAVNHALRSGQEFESYPDIPRAVEAAKARSEMLGRTRKKQNRHSGGRM